MVVLSEEFLKAFTEDFDLATVFHLPLVGLQIKRIECLESCIYLRWLDLSRNEIARMEGLNSLARLEVLDLSMNQVGRVPPGLELPRLERLSLKGNPLRSGADLGGLAGLPKLKFLSLQELDGSSSCPVCQQADYRATMQCLLPELYSLDSQRRHLPSLDVPSDKLDPAAALPKPEPWFSKKDLDLGGLDPTAMRAALKPALAQFEASLAESRELLDRSDKLLNDLA